MKILLDESVPWPMRRLLTQHSVTSVQAKAGAVSATANCLAGQKLTSIYLSHPIKTFSTSKTAGQRIAILELSTNDLRRIRGAAALIEEGVGEIQPAELRRLEIP